MLACQPKYPHTTSLRSTACSPHPAPFYLYLSQPSYSLKIKHLCISLQCVSSLRLQYRYTPVESLSGSPSLAISLSTFQFISYEDIPFNWYMVAGISQVSSRINLALWHLYIEDFFLHRQESVILTELIKDYLSLEQLI